MSDRLSYINWYPIDGRNLEGFLRRTSPPLTPAKLEASIFVGRARRVLRTPTNGDATVAVLYKNREGYVMSMQTNTDDLNVVQVQGGAQEGYRVMTGFDCLGFSAEELVKIAGHPESPFRRITMPNARRIEGIGDASTNASLNYQALAHRSGMVFSTLEQKYVRDLPKK